MNPKSIIGMSFLLLFVGCATKQDKIKDLNIDATPKMQTPKILEPIKRKKGTLYSRRGASLFADKKDLQIGDIILINIAEVLNNDSKDERKTNSTNNTSLSGGIITPSIDTSALVGQAAKEANGFLGMGLTGGSKNAFTGTAESTNEEDFRTAISAIIEQVYQNGNYFIKGSKDMLINGQKQTIRISGVIRPYDISPDNSIGSSQMANLKILYDKKGSEVDATDKPWGSEILEKISPF